ncbi:MAG TPA: cysteine hydrolase family protein [Caldimonas sp.]|jgi:nicotinamidase-related amidase|nr:cysteine hydrolase family protein [Caldimonas sp.]HEX4233374.1 cysteine hydrolase family protein [Caldimonas sp.]
MTEALVLIDLQNDYFPGGTMELVAAEAAVAQAARLLAAFRQQGRLVFHVQHLASRAGATFFLPGTRGAKIHDAVQPGVSERVVTKHFPNSFRQTTLLEDLRAAGAAKLTFAGMMTHMCVDTTVRAAADLGFACSLAHDGCATRALRFAGQPVDADKVQLAYLAALDGSFANVRSAEELCAAL